jgi:hypothetical protein
VKTIPGDSRDKERFAGMEAVISSLPEYGKWSVRNEADYDSAMLNGIGDERIIRDAEEERAASEARLRICTIINYILYLIGWIIGLVGKLYDLPRMDAPEL